MISQKYKDLAHKMMIFTLENGCSDAKIIVYSGTSNSFEYRDTMLDKLEQSSESGMTINIYVDGRFASYSTNRMEEKDLKKFILKGIESARYLAKDEFRKLADPNRYYKGDGRKLDIFDSGFEKISVDEKIELLKSATEEIYGSDERLISVSSQFEDGISSSYIITSNGFSGENETTYYSLSVSAAMKGEEDARPSDYWYDSAIFYDELQKKGIGKKALERTIRKLGQEKMESGVYKMLVDNTQITRLLSPVISALYGSSLQQKSSFLIDKIGETIVSGKLTLIDDPHIPKARGSRWFDSEGVATKKRPVIEKGVLNTYYLDTYYASKMNLEPTVQSPSVLICELGNKNLEQILASLDKGFWITGFNGGNSNSTTGDFSFGIEGFYIENGKIVKPVNEMNITGNLLTLWKNIIEIGNDPMMNSSWRIPAILFDNVNFSGK